MSTIKKSFTFTPSVMPIRGSLSLPALAAVGSRPTVMRTEVWGLNSPAGTNGTSISLSFADPAPKRMTLCLIVALWWMKLAWNRMLSGVMRSPCDGLTGCRGGGGLGLGGVHVTD